MSKMNTGEQFTSSEDMVPALQKVAFVVGGAVMAFAVANGAVDTNKPSSEDISNACNNAGITLRSGVRGAVVNKPTSDRKYIVGLPDERVDMSKRVAGGKVVLGSLDSVVVPGGKSPAEVVPEYVSADELACLNGGLDPSSKLNNKAGVRIARQTFTEKKGEKPVIVESGDTYTSLVRQFSKDPRASVEDAVIETGIPDKKLLPGDIVLIKPGNVSDGNGVAEIKGSDTDALNFESRYRELAVEVERKYGVPADLTLAMAVLESSYGQSELAQKAHNFHGLKANEEWDGAVYEKITTEDIEPDEFSQFDIVGDPELLEDGKTYKVKIRGVFKKFDSDEEGFIGFGEHLKTRLKGTAYKDAFREKSAKGFLRALFNNVGPKYASDIKYVEKASRLINKMKTSVIPDVSDPNPGKPIGVTPWKDLSEYVQGKLESKENYELCMEQLQSANPTPNGFKKFKNNIVDLSDWLPTSGFDSEKLYPSDKEFTENPPRTTVHYTYWSKSAWTHDGKKFAQAQYNHGINSEKQGHPQWGSANAYLSRDGKTLYLITKHNAVASHAGAYNTKARGVETPAYYQKDITSSQYEGLVYTAAYWYLKDHPGRKEKMTYDEAERYLIGHGEITEEVGIGDHSDFTAPFADGLAQKFMNLINTVISEDN